MKRGQWDGLLTILRFNWPFFLLSFALLMGGIILIIFVAHPLVKLIALLLVLGTLYFSVGSLFISHLIYDRSPLYRWTWLESRSPIPPGTRIVYCHSGFDDASPILHQKYPAASVHLLDHYDERLMSEPSIQRARRLYPPSADTISAPFAQWPLDDSSADLVLGFLAIHELRDETDRTLWLKEAGRVLHRGGAIILVEHLRDLPNFLAFGPGFLHFHSRASWCRCWEAAGLKLTGETRITPWIRVFHLTIA